MTTTEEHPKAFHVLVSQLKVGDRVFATRSGQDGDPYELIRAHPSIEHEGAICLHFAETDGEFYEDHFGDETIGIKWDDDCSERETLESEESEPPFEGTAPSESEEGVRVMVELWLSSKIGNPVHVARSLIEETEDISILDVYPESE